MNSTVGLTVTREVKGTKQRVITSAVRDVPALPKKAFVGMDFKCDAGGIRVTKVHEGTSAFDELQQGDIITEIDEEFVAGLELQEVKELLSGPARSAVTLGFKRFDANKKIKRRCEADLIFDHKPTPVSVSEFSILGDVGIAVAAHPRGLKVTNFKKGSSAAASELQIGDVITQVGDELIVGLASTLVMRVLVALS